jgi:DNA topoisomerase-3
VELVVAEKPSGRAGHRSRPGRACAGKGVVSRDHHVITWCIGHLVELADPATQDPAWKRWKLDSLPMLPPRFALVPTFDRLDP